MYSSFSSRKSDEQLEAADEADDIRGAVVQLILESKERAAAAEERMSRGGPAGTGTSKED